MTNSGSGSGSPVEQSATIYDKLMLLRLEEAANGGEPLKPGEWREFRQRIRDVGVVDGQRTDETADLIRAALGQGDGHLPPIDGEDDEAARD